MKAGNARWALSFADLCLLLLGFVLILVARPNAHELAGGMRSAFGGAHGLLQSPANALFEPGEAVLNAKGAKLVADFAKGRRQGGVLVASTGTDGRSARFDGWELAAARSAALARALAQNGIAEKRIALQMDRSSGGGQRIAIEAR